MTETIKSEEWKDECLLTYGEILTGKNAHWCWDWDGMPIDETCKMEMECCTCEISTKSS